MKRAAAALLAIVLTAAPAGGATCLDEALKNWKPLLAKPHHAGDDAHEDFLKFLEGELRSIQAATVDPQERSFTRWDPVEPTISGGGLNPRPEQIWPLPYSGLTSNAGVRAQLYYAGSVGLYWHFEEKKHAGKIVVLKVKPTALLKLRLIARTKRAIPSGRHFFPGEFRRAISFERQIPSLREAQLKGVAGLIVVVDEDPKIAQDQYVPFLRALHNLPAVYVDRDLGDQVIALAKKREEVTLRHEGKLVANAPTRHLLATLPATCKSDDQAIVISTHTDGPNWFEDNGPLALWALLESFANEKEKCRPRDLIFVFAAAHLAHQPGSNDDVVRRNPELFARTRAAVVIEHLGALRYGKKGESEPALVFTTEHDKALNRLTMQVVKKHAKADKSLRPLHIFCPGNLDYGEGVHLEEAEIPTIGFLTNPAYLLQEYRAWHDEWFSPALMCAQIDMLRELIEGMMKLGPSEP